MKARKHYNSRQFNILREWIQETAFELKPHWHKSYKRGDNDVEVLKKAGDSVAQPSVEQRGAQIKSSELSNQANYWLERTSRVQIRF